MIIFGVCDSFHPKLVGRDVNDINYFLLFLSLPDKSELKRNLSLFCSISHTVPDSKTKGYMKKKLFQQNPCLTGIKPGTTGIALNHGYATKEGCRTERKSRNLKHAMGVRLTGFTT
jgi:hypothetical protein